MTKVPPRRARLAPVAFLFLVALFATSACSQEEFACADCNVVLIVADTLRADRLASFGYYRITSPFLDRLAADSLHFTDARSQSACTFPSVNSLLTSRSVSEFLSPETRPGIPDSIESLPAVLRRHGFRTAAVSSSPIVRDTPTEDGLGGGFGQGFDEFDESVLWNDARHVSQAANARIRQLRNDRFFLYVHYMDAHDPYRPLPEHRGTFAREYSGPHEFVAAGKASPIEARLAQGEPAGVSAADMRHLSDLYDESILGLDLGLRMLHNQLSAVGLLERTLVIVTADHGEAFLEHSTVKHCHDLLDTETHVPLILRIPGQDRAQRIGELAENLDVVPTVLDYLGLSQAADGLEGKSLRPLIETGQPVHRHVFSSMGALVSVNDRRFQLIRSLADNRARLFDRVEDPGQSTDLLLNGDAPEGAPLAELQAVLREWIETTGSGLTPEEQTRRAREIEEELRALGYLG